MAKYAHIKFGTFSKHKKIKLKIDNTTLSIVAKSNKWFTNIPIAEGACVAIIDGDIESCELVLSDAPLYHPDQHAFDHKYQIKTHQLENQSVHYSLSGNLISPKKILITFPGVSSFDNIHYRLSALTSLQASLGENVLILALQDKEGVYGNYMFETPNGYPIRAITTSLISGLCAKYRLIAQDLIFYGNSKGGSIALDYISLFPQSNFFIDIPQLELYNYDRQNDLMSYSLGEKARHYYNYVKYLPTIINKNVTYAFAENDFDASRGLPMRSFENINVVLLKDMGHSNSAMELVKRQFSKIIQITNNTKTNIRPPISAKFSIKNEFIYISRVLSAFKDETSLKKIYAEIEFSNGKYSFSVSLNKKFIDTIIVYWQYGFDVKKHLPIGEYSMLLHIYTDYKEIVYPLNQRLIVNNLINIIEATEHL
jgi:hypothetical protein